MGYESGMYLISSGSVNIFPDNKRCNFINRLAKPISPQYDTNSTIFISLDSIVIENFIIQYTAIHDFPDIIYFTKPTHYTPDVFQIPEIYFESSEKFFEYLKSSCNGIFLKTVDFRNGKFSIQTNGSYTLISKRFIDFLRLSINKDVQLLGKQKTDPRFKRYYIKFYVIEYGTVCKLHANHEFDLNVHLPSILKVFSSDIKQCLSGGGYIKHIATVPLDVTRKRTFFTPTIPEYFPPNSFYLQNMSIQLVNENNTPIPFSTGAPSIIRLNVKEMNSVHDSFHIQIESSDSKTLFPTNTASQFKSKLSKTWS